MSKEHPIVSIVISTYNRPQMLDKALDSVQAQTFTDYEVLVVDDCSPPKGPTFPPEYLAVLEKHGALFEQKGISFYAYRLGENSGYQCMPKNRGIEKAAGDYIAYLDDDNEWTPDHLAVATNALEYKPATETEGPGEYSAPNFSVDMVYTRLHYEIADEQVIKPTHTNNSICSASVEDDRLKRKRRCTEIHRDTVESLTKLYGQFAGDAPGQEWDPRKLTIGNYIDTSSIVHSKGAFWRLVREDGYGWDETLRRFGDWNFVWRWGLCGNTAQLVDRVTVKYRIHSGSLQVTRQAIEVPVCLSYEQYRQYAKEIRTL